ncbi:hypothetical protein [Thomasclavelia ramosa]|nr:hypothetical protein [Thomasclavelia ramosa]
MVYKTKEIANMIITCVKKKTTICGVEKPNIFNIPNILELTLL